MFLPGIVVEETETHYSPEAPALQKGDVLLSWSQGDARGEFESPTILWWLTIDQTPLGPVTVRGWRGGEERAWVLRTNDFYLKARPNFRGLWLARYEHARVLAKEGKVSQAAKQWIAMAQSLPTEHAWLPAWLCYHAGRVLTEHHLWKHADRAYAEAVRRAGDGVSLLAPMQRFWGWNLWESGEWSAADEHYLEILREVRKAGKNLAAEQFLIVLATNAGNRGNLRQQREYALAALAIDEQLAPEGRGTATALFTLGNAAFASGDLDEADRRFGSALEVYRKVAPGERNVAATLVGLANVAIARADFARADKYLREALLVETRVGDFSTGALAGLGYLAGNRNDLVRAREFYRRMLDVARKKNPKSIEVADSLTNLGDVYREEGDLSQADRCVRQALRIAQGIAPRGEHTAAALGNLGEIAADRGRAHEAETYLLQSLALEEKLEGDAGWTADVAVRLERLGDLAKGRSNLRQAAGYYARAGKMLTKLSPWGAYYAESLAGLADVARLKGDVEASSHYYEDALKALEGRAARLGGSTETRAGFRARYEDIYRGYVNLLLRLNKPELAFQILERSRARTLLETLAAANVDIRKGADPELIAKERLLQTNFKAKSQRRIHLLNDKHNDEELKAVEREISNLSSEYQDVEAQIRSSSPVYAALTQPQPLSLTEIQTQVLDPDTVLLEYSLGEESSHVFVVSADALHVVELPRRIMIEAAARHVYALLTARNLRKRDETPAMRLARLAQAETEYPVAAARLSRIVLGPVWKQLTGKRLLIVSDGALHYVPFAALPLTAPGKPPSPLAAEHEVVNLPSASTLSVIRHERMGREPATKTVAVLADPVFDNRDARVKHLDADLRRGQPVSSINGSHSEEEESEESLRFAHLTRSASDVGWQGRRRGEVYLPRLRFSRQEADAIAAVTSPGQVLEALDFQASRATALEANLASYRIVHFATHALLDSKHPELSGLVLSLVDERGRPQNGFLDLQDIYNLNLPAELVVLSV
jgi:CHAT domain-containing protein/Tfp pilus assembly protein PilF